MKLFQEIKHASFFNFKKELLKWIVALYNVILCTSALAS